MCFYGGFAAAWFDCWGMLVLNTRGEGLASGASAGLFNPKPWLHIRKSRDDPKPETETLIFSLKGLTLRTRWRLKVGSYVSYNNINHTWRVNHKPCQGFIVFCRTRNEAQTKWTYNNTSNQRMTVSNYFSRQITDRISAHEWMPSGNGAFPRRRLPAWA